MKRKLTTIALSLLVVMTTATAFAKSFKVDGVKYKLSKDKTFVIAKEIIKTQKGGGFLQYAYSGIDSIFIPKEITVKGKTYPVLIGDCAFHGFKGMVVIEEYTFDNVDIMRLKKMNASHEGYYCVFDYYFRSFYDGEYHYSYPYNGYNVTIRHLFISDELTEIPKRALYRYHSNNYNITIDKITIPNTITAIGEKAFSECKINQIAIPNSVTSIGAEAFYNSFQGKPATLMLPNTITGIGTGAFMGCSSLTVNIPESLTRIEKDAFRECRFVQLNIPNSVTSIGECAFDNCRYLSVVNIPKSVTQIGGAAFRCCKSLINVTFEGSQSDIEIDRNAFEDTPIGDRIREIEYQQAVQEYEQQRSEIKKQAAGEMATLKRKLGSPRSTI